jgi:L-ascorbate metabolism protein UlaG (beta-lactamase superfamily)
MEHVAWLVEAGGRRILHLGDAKMAPEEFEQFPWLAGLGIDVAFVPFWFIDREGGADVISRLIAPKTVVLVHWNRWNRESVAEDLELQKANLPPTVMFSEPFEKRVF